MDVTRVLANVPTAQQMVTAWRRALTAGLPRRRRSPSRALDSRRGLTGTNADTIAEILHNIAAATQGELDDALTRALVSVGGLTTVDRAYLGRLSDDGRTLRWDFQWCADGVARVPETDLLASLDALPWLSKRIAAGRVVHVEDVAALPAEAGPEKARWLSHESRSLLVIPMLDEGRPAGMLAFESVRSVGAWGADEIRLMDTLGQILVHAWQRRRADQARRRSEERVRLLNENLERRVLAATAELRSSHDALRESEERYRRIVENLGELQIFYSHDNSGTFTYVSPSYRRILDCSSLEELGKLVRFWLDRPCNLNGRHCSERTRLGYKQPVWDFEIETGGRTHILEVLAVPVFDADGVVTSIEGVARDVTEERQNARLVVDARERLLEARKLSALGDMVAGLSHEMATPVGIAVTAASHLEALCADGSQAFRQRVLTRSGLETLFDSMDQTARAIHANLQRSADLLETFKEVAADSSTDRELDFDLGQDLKELVASFSPRLRNTGVRVMVDCPPGIVLHGDARAVQRVFSNLLVNSLNHGFEGMLVGRIEIGVRHEGEAVIIEYRDDGKGMTGGELARLYEPFYTTKRGRGGTGLGMHIVHTNVTRSLGGTISCASKPGRGTRFQIVIPARAEVQHA